ncbi:glycine zipper 2TM domain-containing protein [Klebsiella variicola]|uniref:glycine zipper 2TM domain-containing protein n=1 Tax=Klebsiella variicola TaxID=244366 RepID=UPI002380FA98|nr:glycine zipper 2TM domain-containing protein [Klebsiella variicola]MDE4678705.1 glycine zipper 2TM domain-containing protein [Klebsiella variicola]
MLYRFCAIIIILGITGCTNTSHLSGDVHSASAAGRVQQVFYGTLVSVRPVQIQAGDENNALGAVAGGVIGGIAGSTVGGGSGRRLSTATGAVAGGLAGQGVQSRMNLVQGVELEIRLDDGRTIMVVQRQGPTRFSAGQRVTISSSGGQTTVSPR